MLLDLPLADENRCLSPTLASWARMMIMSNVSRGEGSHIMFVDDRQQGC